MHNIGPATQATRDVVEALYAAYVAGDLEATAAGLSDDVDWAILAPEYLFDFAGARQGRAGVLAALQEIRRTYEFLAYEPQFVLADGDHACAYVTAKVRDRTTGSTAELELCDVMRLEGGRIVWFREFIDSVRAAIDLFGRRAAA
jgi:ketosteroid isomerase-like protein